MKKSNRTGVLRMIIEALGGYGESIFVRGPNQAFGKKGEVSYVAVGTGLNKYQKEQVCTSLKEMYSDVVEAYVTRTVKQSWRTTGGNIKIVWRTRSNGTPA